MVLINHGVDPFDAAVFAAKKIDELNALPSGSELKFQAGNVIFTIKKE